MSEERELTTLELIELNTRRSSDADTIEYLRAALARTNADYAALLKTSIEALEAAIRLRSAMEAVQQLLPKNGKAAASLIDAALAGTPPLERTR